MMRFTERLIQAYLIVLLAPVVLGMVAVIVMLLAMLVGAIPI